MYEHMMCVILCIDETVGSISRLKEFLQIPVIPAVQLQNKGKKLENARVLTSSEFLHELEEKERLKAKKEAQKQLQKRQREEKKAQKRALQTKRMGQKVCYFPYHLHIV